MKIATKKNTHTTKVTKSYSNMCIKHLSPHVITAVRNNGTVRVYKGNVIDIDIHSCRIG